MSNKYVFQNARIKSMETKLLTSQHLQRLLDCSSVDEAFKLLLEVGFGVGFAVENNNFDALFEHEEKNQMSVLKEFNVDGALDAFLLMSDFHNLKALLKANLMSQTDPVLMSEGLYSVIKLKESVTNGDVSDLSEEMGIAIATVGKLVIDEKVTPHAIDTIVDKAMYLDIFKSLKKSGKLAKEYFVKKVDYINMLAFLRCKKLELLEKFFTDGFIQGGEFDCLFFSSIYDSSIEVLREKCKYTTHQEIVAKVVESGKLVGFEVEVDNTLLKMWKKESGDMFSLAPIVSFYLTKVTELKVVKLIVAGIKNNVDRELITERMREIYA